MTDDQIAAIMTKALETAGATPADFVEPANAVKDYEGALANLQSTGLREGHSPHFATEQRDRRLHPFADFRTG